MTNVQQMGAVLKALPDPVFILSRSGKYVAVFGGNDERFCHVAERLWKSFRQELNRFSVRDVMATASSGVATMLPEDRSYEDTIRRADGALYQAKAGGKDRVVSV